MVSIQSADSICPLPSGFKILLSPVNIHRVDLHSLAIYCFSTFISVEAVVSGRSANAEARLFMVFATGQ